MRTFLALTLFMLFNLVTGSAAFAGAVIDLRGELYSVNQFDVQIKTKTSILRVDRSALTPLQQKMIEAPGVSGKLVQLEVPIGAIKGAQRLDPQPVASQPTSAVKSQTSKK